MMRSKFPQRFTVTAILFVLMATPALAQSAEEMTAPFAQATSTAGFLLLLPFGLLLLTLSALPRAETDASQAAIAALDRKSTRLNSSHTDIARMPSSA